jgi:hypothetical protein
MAELFSATYLPPAGTYAHPFLNRYLLLLVEGTYYVVGTAVGWFADKHEFKLAMQYAPASFLVLGRSISMLAGVATLVLTYALGLRLRGHLTGLIASVFLAVSAAHIAISVNLRPWSLATAFAAAAILFFVIYMQEGNRKTLVLAAAASGLAAATAYPMFLLVLPMAFLLAHGWLGREPGLRGRWLREHVAPAFVVGAAAFTLADLQAIVNVPKVVEAVRQPTASAFSDGPFAVGYLHNLVFYLESPFHRMGLGVLVASLAVIGIAVHIRERRTTAMVFLLFLAGVFLVQPAVVIFMANRYTVPAYPVLAVSAAYGLVALATRAKAALEMRPGPRGLAALAVLAALPSAAGTYGLVSSLLGPGTRTLAKEWIEENVEPGATLVFNIKSMSPVLVDCSDIQNLPDWASDSPRCYNNQYLEGNADVLESAESRGGEYVVFTRATPEAVRKRFGISDALDKETYRNFVMVGSFVSENDLTEDTVFPDPSIYVLRRMTEQ